MARVDRAWGKQLDPVRELALGIQLRLDQISGVLDRLCAATCPACRDNCCERATIWYDFRDLVYLYFVPGQMPDFQILKAAGPSGGHCPNLDSGDCGLSRGLRPFVCTWYLCPAQKGLAGANPLTENILEIKKMRSRMEDEFCRITAG